MVFGIRSIFNIRSNSAINAIKNVKNREKRTFKYRAYTERAYANMDLELDNIDWDEFLERSEDDQIHSFHRILFQIFDKCFPQKTKTVLIESDPFYTEKLAKLRRKKGREYNKHRKSDKYIAPSKIYKRSY